MFGGGRRIKPCTTTTVAGDGGGSCWLPVELMVEIVKRLPTAASIGRFRCVSKSWYCLLSNPNFIRKALLFDDNGITNKDQDKKARVMIICHGASEKSVVSLSYDTLQPVSSVMKLEYVIPETKSYGASVVVGGCCDGIFCFYSSSRNNSESNVILWNPTTSDCRVLPSLSPLLSRPTWMMNIGFGYDPSTNDYKVVALVRYSCSYPYQRSVYLYSLRNNSWKALCSWDASICYEVFQSRHSSAKVERCYWTSSSGCFIGSFNFSKHVFNKVMLPPKPNGSCVSRETVYMLGDYVVSLSFDPSKKRSYVWSLNYDNLERGCGGQCWIKLYTVGEPSFLHTACSDIPAGIWEHGKCFVMSQGRLHVVDFDNGGHNSLQIKGDFFYFCEIRAYMPSPVSLSSRWWANEVCSSNGVSDLCSCFTSK
ncbi:Putative F-box protein At3g16210 [Linum perenne]